MKTPLRAARSPFSRALVTLSCVAVSLGGCALATDDPEAVGEAAQAAVSFPGSLTATLGNNVINNYEPSGLALIGTTLYMASDKGHIARYDAASNHWITEVTTSDDFESLTVATNNQLMAGVEEGPNNTPASIKKVDLTSKSIAWTWSLPFTGMEAMTFVPESYTPFGQANLPAHPGDFNGYFFVATQNNVGVISAYRLDRGASSATKVGQYSIDITLKTSDMAFANGALYVLFDDSTDALAIYTINTNPANKVLLFQKQYDLPSVGASGGSNVNYEGIAFDHQTIYLGRDNNHDHGDDGVFEFANTGIFPNAVLSPLWW